MTGCRGPARARALLGALLLWWGALLGPAGPAVAHEMSMAEMVIHEVAPGDFVWQWTAGQRSGSEALQPVWPTACAAEGQSLRCGAGGLVGTLGMEGIGRGVSAVLVKLHWREGGLRVYTISAGQPTVQLHGAAQDRRGVVEIVRAYGALGVTHILGGFDHLLFVLGLLFLVGLQRRLVWTLTAFTFAHSITLGLSATGWISLRAPPVEATIALSILLVAGEALHQRPTLSRRWPALVALLFGLVHGLGFAGALREIGLPENHLLPALLSFNLGVEAGQLMVVGVAWAVHRALAGWPAYRRARTAVLYGIGGLAGFWTVERVAQMLA